MAIEEKKKLQLTTNKALIYLVVASWAVTLILFLSGFKKLNPYLLLLAFIASAALVYYLIKRPKDYDIYRIVEEWTAQHYKKYHSFLDTRDFQVVPLTPVSAYVHLPFEGMVAFFEGNKIKGIEFNHIYRVLRRQEKSKLFSESIKYLGAESKLRQSAEALNVDLKSLGLEQ